MMDSGDVVFLTVPIYDGYDLPHDITMFGKEADRFFFFKARKSPEDPHRILGIFQDHCGNFETERRDVKEELSHLALNYETACTIDRETSLLSDPRALGNGNSITIRDARVPLKGVFFKPCVGWSGLPTSTN